MALCELSEEEIAAIAEHEHIHEMLAVELGNYLVQSEDGERKIRSIILDDIDNHRKRGDQEGVDRLELVLKYFLATHPKADVRA